MDGQLTQEQLNAMLSLNKMSPEQSKSALGSANNLLQKGISFVEGALPTAGAIAGGIGGAAAGSLAGPAGAYAGGIAGAGLGGAAGEAGKEAIQGQGLNAGSIAAAGGENAALDAIGGPILSGAGKLLGKVSETAGGVLKGAAKLFGAGFPPTEKQTAKAVLDAVTPKMTAKETGEAIASRGGTKTGILGKIQAKPDPKMKEVADAVQNYVPKFNPKSSLTENVNATRDAVYGMADNLKQQVIQSGKDVIYPFKELASKIDDAEEPISLKGTPFEKQIAPIKKAALQIAQKNGGNISSLFDTRKEFDALVNKTYPNLWDKENAPMRNAVTAVRNSINDFIAEKLPDVGFKDSLHTQSKLFTAIDNMSEKAAKEVGTNVIDRTTGAIKKHPVLSALGAGALIDEAKKIPVIGGLIP